MYYLFQTLGKLEKCADVARERIWLQMLIILVVALLEALFIFFLISFLETFGQSSKSTTEEPSLIVTFLEPIFGQIGLPFNLYSLASLLCLVALLRETASVVNQYTLQILFGKVEVGVQRKVVSITLAATYLSTSHLGGGKFMELCNICARESAKAVLSLLQLYSISITLVSYCFVLVLTTPTVAAIASLLTFLSFLCLNYTTKKALAAGKKIVRIRETLAICLCAPLDHFTVDEVSSPIKGPGSLAKQHEFCGVANNLYFAISDRNAAVFAN